MQMFDRDAMNKPETTIPRFYTLVKKDERETVKQGKPIFVEVEMLEVITPGDKYNVWHGPVNDFYKEKYSRAYEAFIKGREQMPDGFPLESWPYISAAAVATLKAINCRTVEQLAGMPEANRPKLPEFYKLQQKAQEFIEAQNDNAVTAKLQVENDELRREMQHLANTVDALKKQIAEGSSEDGVPKRRGRPPKVA